LLDGGEEMEAWLRAERHRALAFKWSTRGLFREQASDKTQQEEDETPTQEEESSIHQVQVAAVQKDSDDSYEVTEATTASSLLRRCNLILGMHPDQAAGDIAAFATFLGVPWCVVPCCVYSDVFPKRRLNDGTQVKNYDQLIQWLLETYPKAKLAILDMGGRNQVVYSLS